MKLRCDSVLSIERFLLTVPVAMVERLTTVAKSLPEVSCGSTSAGRPQNSGRNRLMIFISFQSDSDSVECFPNCNVQVTALKAVPPGTWTDEEFTLAVATNEHLERMLVGLDSVTGLTGDDRSAKKQAVQFINQLCAQLDSLRSCTKRGSEN